MGFGRRAIRISEKGANSGVATLDTSGDLVAGQVPPTVVLTTGNQNIAGVKAFTDTTPHTAPGTGALVCQGGASIAGDLGVAGVISSINLYSDTIAGITQVGHSAGGGNNGVNQTVMGRTAGFNNSGLNQVAMGRDAGRQNRGDSQVVVGHNAGYSNHGDNQTAIGVLAGRDNTGDNTVFIGHEAGRDNTLHNYFELKHSTANATPLISGFFDTRVVTLGSVILDAITPYTASGTGALVCQGGASIAGDLGVAGAISGSNLYSDADGLTWMGFNAGFGNIGNLQTAVGRTAGQNNTGGGQTVLGCFAGLDNAGSDQTAVGIRAGQNNVGSDQTAVGRTAGYNNTGNLQTAVGRTAGYNNTADNTVFIGHEAGYANALPNYFELKHSTANATPLISGFFDTRTVTFADMTFSPAAAPASATASGVAGEIRMDSNYIYRCTAANTWKRVAISTW